MADPPPLTDTSNSTSTFGPLNGIANRLMALVNCESCRLLFKLRSGRFLGIIGRDPSVCKSDRLPVHIFRFFLYWNGVYFITSVKVIGNSHGVLMKFNRLFLKINRFICNKLLVLPDHRFQVSKWKLRCKTWESSNQKLSLSLYFINLQSKCKP